MSASRLNLRSMRLFSIKLGPWRFSPGLLPTIATLLTLTLLINLGFWQLRRAEFKEQLEQRFSERSKVHSMNINDLVKLAENSSDYPLEVTGHFIQSKTFLLDNKTHQGIPGFEVIIPLQTDKFVVLVNRGWVPMGRTRQSPLLYPRPTEKVIVKGHTHVPNPNYFVLKEDNYQDVSWPFIIQKIDLKKSENLFDQPLAPFIIREAPAEGSGFVREWRRNPIGPERHYGYAVQWFALALALIIIYLVTNSNRINTTIKQEDV